MLKMIFRVPLIMGCALVGTIGMIKAIKKFCPKYFDDAKADADEEVEQ